MPTDEDAALKVSVRAVLDGICERYGAEEAVELTAPGR
jgi:hypothetical protein